MAEPEQIEIVAHRNNEGFIEEVDMTKFKCLIANDDYLQLTILENLFERQGFEVVTAQNGQSAYEEVLKTAAPNTKGFDLIVLDLCMPVTDGYEACRLIKAHFNSANLLMPQVIAVSGYVDDGVESQTALCGFERVFEMPLGVPQITDVIVPELVMMREMKVKRENLAMMYKKSGVKLNQF